MNQAAPQPVQPAYHVGQTQPQVALLVLGSLLVGFWIFGGLSSGYNEDPSWVMGGLIALGVGAAMLGLRSASPGARTAISIGLGVGLAFILMMFSFDADFEAFFSAIIATLGTVLIISGLPRRYSMPAQPPQ